MANGYGTQMGLALWLPLCFTAPHSPFQLKSKSDDCGLLTH